MHTQTPYYQFLTSLFCLQLDRPLGCWGCCCSLTHQNKYWLGTLCSRVGGQVLLSALSAKARLDTTSHHLPLQIFDSFLFLFSSQMMLFFFHGALQISSSPTDSPHSPMGWVIFEGEPFVTGWSPSVWDLGSNPVVVNPYNACKGGVLEGFFCYWYWLIMAQNKKIGFLVPRAVSLATLW